MIVTDAHVLGFDPARLERVTRRIEADIESGRCNGVAMRVALHGQVVIDLCEGYADRDAGMPLEPDSVFHLLSLSKALTAIVALKLIEDGVFQLTTPIAEVLPEFGRVDKQAINVFHLLTHSGGLAMDTPGVPPEIVANLEHYAAWTFERPAACRAGEQVAYSVLVAHSVLGLFMQRASGRSFNELMHDHLLAPLAMRDTAFGPRADLMARRCPLQAAPYLFSPDHQHAANITATHIARITAYATTAHAVVPGGGAFSTLSDMCRLVEMLRRGGELHGQRILSPAMVELLARNHTGDMPNQIFKWLFAGRHWLECPAYLGLGFWGRGETPTPGPFGALNSPRTFGSIGRGTGLFWVDPLRDLSLVLLSTGLMDEADNFVRYQTLSDLVVSSLVNNNTA